MAVARPLTSSVGSVERHIGLGSERVAWEAAVLISSGSAGFPDRFALRTFEVIEIVLINEVEDLPRQAFRPRS